MLGLMILMILLIIYFLPALIACAHLHTKTASITIINIFLGWTLLGWVLALSWAFSEKNVKDN